MTDLGTLPGDADSEAFDINEQGQIVGFSCTSSGSCRPVLWQGGGAPVELNTIVPPTSGWYLFDANAINERGQFVGGGINPQGQFDAYLATPVH
jgi:probable HAF family extracellular repeat protein